MLQSISSSLAVEAQRQRAACRGRSSSSSRRLDLIIAILCSLALHGALLFDDAFFPKKAAPPPPAAAVERIMQIEIVPLEEEELEVTELEDSQKDNVGESSPLAPPTLPELPSVAVSIFTQPIQITPHNIEVSRNAVSIPAIRAGRSLGSDAGAIFDIASLDQIPMTRSRVLPIYPSSLRDRGARGTVTVEFVVNTEGNVVNVTVTESSRIEFELPAIAAIERWKFRPGMKGGRVVNTRVSQVISFSMQEN